MAQYRVLHKSLHITSLSTEEVDDGLGGIVSRIVAGPVLVYAVGEVVDDPSDAVLTAFGDKLERVDDAMSLPSSESAPILSAEVQDILARAESGLATEDEKALAQSISEFMASQGWADPQTLAAMEWTVQDSFGLMLFQKG